MKTLIVAMMIAILLIPGKTMARIVPGGRVSPRPSVRVTPRPSVRVTPKVRTVPKVSAPKLAPKPAPKTNYGSNHSTVHRYIPTWVWLWWNNKTEQKQEKVEHFGCGRWKEKHKE